MNGAESGGDEAILPDHTLYVPTVGPPGPGGTVQLALKPLEDGRLAMPLYTSQEALVQGCGDQQAWVEFTETQVEQAFHASEAEVAMVDAQLTDEQQWSADTRAQSVDEYVGDGDRDARGDG